jgi:hypothetical protein
MHTESANLGTSQQANLGSAQISLWMVPKLDRSHRKDIFNY